MSTPTQQFIQGLKTKKFISFAISCLVTLIIWNLPLNAFGIEGLTEIHRRIIAVFAFAILCWITECIPAWATSVSVIGILLFATSDSALAFMTSGYEKTDLLSYKSLLATFADPIVILFLGGFILAEAASKTGLDVVFARTLLKPFGQKSEIVLLGFLLVTGVFSMFVSNTATAAMMLTFLAPVFKALPSDGKGRIALTLAIPVAANIGGIGSPIGTPPNMIALKYLNDPEGLNLNIGFGQWMLVMLPYAILLLLIGWFLLKKMFPFKAKTIDLRIEGELKKDWRTVVVAITFIVTVLLWLLDRVTGVNSNVVAMLPIAVFAITGVIKASDLKGLSWDVLWMVAGGFALGLALNSSGLAEKMISSVPFGSFSPIAILIISGLICYILSNFISNTATAALLVPILALVAKGMGDSINGIGGVATILIGVAISASCAMCLPISTPPNAIAYSTGLVEQKQMLRIGLLMGIIGMVFGYGLLILLGQFGYF